MLRFAAKFLFGPTKAPLGAGDRPVPREKAILAALIAAVFWLGLFPDEPMRKTEFAAREYQQLVLTSRVPGWPRPRPRPRVREQAMNWNAFLVGMLPEHFLLAGCCC